MNVTTEILEELAREMYMRLECEGLVLITIDLLDVGFSVHGPTHVAKRIPGLMHVLADHFADVADANAEGTSS